VTSTFVRLLPVLCLALLATACDLFDGDETGEPPATATTGAAVIPSPTPQPLPTSAPLQPGDSIALTWREVELPPAGDELTRPFQDRVAEQGGAGEDLWRVYTVDGDDSPRLQHESRHWVTGADWAEGGESLIISDWTMLAGPDGGAIDVIPEAQKLIPGEPEAVWEVRLPGGWYGWSAGDFAIVSHRTGGTPVLLFADGTAWEPSAQGGPELNAVSPDGRFVRLRLNGRGIDPDTHYIAEPRGDAAIFAGVALRAVFSPGAEYLALYNLDALTLFDTATGDVANVPFPVALGYGVPLRWSDDARYLVVNDGVLDVTKKTWLLEPAPRDVIDAALSPDGRTLALTLDIFGGEERPCEEPALLNKTLLIDVASRVESTLVDCDHFFSAVNWVGTERFLTFTHTCWACEGRSWPYLVSTADGAVQSLANDFSSWAAYRPSPDGSKILFTGPELRIYAPDGALLRSIAVEPGYEVTRAAWRPDGSGFVYVVGPKDFVII
jgi:hypothetical protein